MNASYYDPAERAAEKQRSRDRDDADLASGRITREDLHKRNSLFASLDISKAHVRLSKRSFK